MWCFVRLLCVLCTAWLSHHRHDIYLRTMTSSTSANSEKEKKERRKKKLSAERTRTREHFLNVEQTYFVIFRSFRSAAESVLTTRSKVTHRRDVRFHHEFYYVVSCRTHRSCSAIPCSFSSRLLFLFCHFNIKRSPEWLRNAEKFGYI